MLLNYGKIHGALECILSNNIVVMKYTNFKFHRTNL